MSRALALVASFSLAGCFSAVVPLAPSTDGGALDSADLTADTGIDTGIDAGLRCVPFGEDAGVFEVAPYRETLVRATVYGPVYGLDSGEFPPAGRFALEELALSGEVLNRVEVDRPLELGLTELPRGELFPMWSGEVVFASPTWNLFVGCRIEEGVCRSLPEARVADPRDIPYRVFSDGRFLYARTQETVEPRMVRLLRLDLREPEPRWERGWEAEAVWDAPPERAVPYTLVSRRVGLVEGKFRGLGEVGPGFYRIVGVDWPCTVEVAPFTEVWDVDLREVPFMDASGEQVGFTQRDAMDISRAYRCRRRAPDATILSELFLPDADWSPTTFELADGRFVVAGYEHFLVVDSDVTLSTTVALPVSRRRENRDTFGPRFPTNYPGDAAVEP